MNRKYYFTDETPMFRCPVQPKAGEEVLLRFQAAAEDDVQITLIHGKERLALMPGEIDGARRFHRVKLTLGRESLFFYYEIRDRKTGEVCLYDKRGLVYKTEKEYSFAIRTGYVIPEWLQGRVMYHIFVDRFCNGDRSNDVEDREYVYLKKRPVEKVRDWNSVPAELDVGRFYGGDLVGVRKKLDYLQNLGVEVLYLNPIFVSPSNHKYDTQDYDYVDPHLTVIAEDGGTVVPLNAEDNTEATMYRKRIADQGNLEASNRYFAEFVEEVHRRGMRIILDGVFNHCGSFNRWMDYEHLYEKPGMTEEEKGAWLSAKSRYRSYFKFEDTGKFESWWDNITLPKLNYEGSIALQEEILRIAAKWVSPPYHVDGWRLDVAADLGHSLKFNHEFWKRFRDTVKAANPDAVILAEHYGDVSPWLEGGEWDTVMNYDAFMEPVTWFLTGMEKHSDSYKADLDGNADYFWSTMQRNMAKFSYGSAYGAMNQLDNHDHSRFLTRTNRVIGRLEGQGSEAAGKGIRYGILRQAVIMQMTWPGAPTLYYGDETGVCGWTDPDSRRTYPWGSEDWQLIEFYKYAIGIHSAHSACRTGSLVKLYSGSRMIAYGRFDETEQIVVVVNVALGQQTTSLDLSVMGTAPNAPWIRIMQTNEKGYNVGKLPTMLRDGCILDITAPAMSATVYRTANARELLQFCRNEQE